MAAKNSRTRAQGRTRSDRRLVPVLRRIAQRADELWTAGGRVHGTDLECWLQAEREVFRHEALRSGIL